jgi:hypothetical protein
MTESGSASAHRRRAGTGPQRSVHLCRQADLRAADGTSHAFAHFVSDGLARRRGCRMNAPPSCGHSPVIDQSCSTRRCRRRGSGRVSRQRRSGAGARSPKCLESVGCLLTAVVTRRERPTAGCAWIRACRCMRPRRRHGWREWNGSVVPYRAGRRVRDRERATRHPASCRSPRHVPRATTRAGARAATARCIT